MKAFFKITVLLLVLFFSSTAFAIPNAWLGTDYTIYSPSYYSSSCRSPVTSGHLDLRLFIDNVTFTDLEFSVSYDTVTVQEISDGSVCDIRAGLAFVSATTENLEGTWKKTTIVLDGDITIGAVSSQSDAICRIRFIPIAEGTMPVGLWDDSEPMYPASYKTCSLSLENSGDPVAFDRKDWNDATTLFTFTDKTSATLMYEYDFNFGNPITNGFLRIVYDDDSIEDFHTSDPGRGIVIATTYGGYFVTPQTNAVSYTLMFPEYYDNPLSLTGGCHTNHSQPSGYFDIKELADGFNDCIPTSADDIILTIELPGIGVDFASHVYGAAIAGDTAGVLSKSLVIGEIDDDSVSLTIGDGLEEDSYNLYIYKDGLILGCSWFSASPYYDVTFTVENQNSTVMPGVEIIIPKFTWQGQVNVVRITDINGQATFELPGNSEWGSWFDFYATHIDCENYEDHVEVFDSNLEVPVVMSPAVGVNLIDFAEFSSWWASPDCQWNSNCDGFDFNYDGTVDLNDLDVFVVRWLNQN